MRKTSDLNEILATLIGEGGRHGMMHQTLDDGALDGRAVPLGGRALVNFASCSYMGLETDERLIAGACEAARRYGTQLSSSRLFLSAAPYAELERLLSALAGGHALAVPTTSLGHLAALPVLVEEEDAVIYDQRLHHSVQIALRLLPGTGVHLEMVKHNRLDLLEARIRMLRQRHRKVWYVADGIYSIFGDRAPLEPITELLDRYEQLHAYFDDAHGTSWLGTAGRGHVLGGLAGHPRVVVALSLNKAFAAAGGCLVFADAETRDRVRSCGGPLNFSGPIQPPMLGAALASARLHLSPEWPARQAELARLIAHTRARLTEAGLPLCSPGDSPILFVGMGLPRAAHLMGARLREAGYFVTAATFPGVPVKQSGMRLSLTRHLTPTDVDGLVQAMADALPGVLGEAGSSLAAVREAFDLPSPVPAGPSLATDMVLELRVHHCNGAPAWPGKGGPMVSPSGLTLTAADSIRALDAAEWDAMLGAEGTFTAAGLALLEDVFGAGRPGRREDAWKFRYWVVRDQAGKPVLATFFTEALWKDDMVAREDVSAAVEQERARRRDPYYLTTHTFAMGSLLTEGRHLWLDRQGPWQEALDMLLAAAGAEQRARGANVLALRDFVPGDQELDAFLQARGFYRFLMPASTTITLAPTAEAHWDGLSRRSRQLYREHVLPKAAKLRFAIIEPGGRALSQVESDHLDGLYRNVHARSLEFNTFDLPKGVYADLAGRAPWEIVLAYLDPEHGGPANGLPIAAGGCFVGPGTYTPLVLGIDYAYRDSHAIYRAMLWHALGRARELGARKLYLGVGAPLEKARLGGVATPQCAYFQAINHDNMDELLRFMETVGRGA